MKKIHVVFHDGGGGHRNAAVALKTVIVQQERDWQIELIQFQDLTDRLDVLRKLTGIRIQKQYNILRQNGWTLGSTHLLRVLQTTNQLPGVQRWRLLKPKLANLRAGKTIKFFSEYLQPKTRNY